VTAAIVIVVFGREGTDIGVKVAEAVRATTGEEELGNATAFLLEVIGGRLRTQRC
jgi:hypothetical protein